jgi:hypothetical protein
MAKPRTNEQLDREIEEAIVRGARATAAEPRAVRAWYDADSGRVMVELTSGILFGFPSEFGQGLRGATARELAAVEIEGGGYGLHWEALDADLTVPGLVAGVFGSEVWMREPGGRGGSATTAAKQRAARLNGQKGGRPRKARRVDVDRGTTGVAVHTVPDPAGSGWAIRMHGKVVGNHQRKDAAVEQAREIARANKAEHVIHKRDGTISERHRYGTDPGPPRDSARRGASNKTSARGRKRAGE